MMVGILGLGVSSARVAALALLLFSTCTHSLPAAADDDFHWVATWTSMPQEVEQNNLPPSPFVSFSLPLFQTATKFEDAPN
jgi:hypothetical protein